MGEIQVSFVQLSQRVERLAHILQIARGDAAGGGAATAHVDRVPATRDHVGRRVVHPRQHGVEASEPTNPHGDWLLHDCKPEDGACRIASLDLSLPFEEIFEDEVTESVPGADISVDTQGAPALRAQIATEYAAVGVEGVIGLAAPEEGIFLTMHALLEPGDHVVVLTPDLERTSAAIAEATGCELKRVREVTS